MLELLSPELKAIGEQLVDNNVTLNQAQDALNAVQLLRNNNIPLEQWQRLAQASEELSEPDFRESAFRLLKLEQDTGRNYRDAVNQRAKLEDKIRLQEEAKEKAQKEIEVKLQQQEAVEKEIASGHEQLKKLNRRIKEAQQKANLEKARTDQILKGEGVTREEIKDFCNTKTELKLKGFDIPSFILIANEFANSRDLIPEVRGRLKETHSLAETQTRLKAENYELKRANTESKSKLDALKVEVNTIFLEKQRLLSEAASLADKINNGLNQLGELTKLRQMKKRQYDLFEALLAVLTGGTPYQDATPQKLASEVLKVVQAWYAERPIRELRSWFVIAVCGNLLHSARCHHCGARFIVDRPPNSHFYGYHCPVCNHTFTETNDEFLKAMFSEEEFALQMELKPLEVFLDIPCSICGKPMPHNWTRQQVVEAFKDCRHNLCLR
jgi:hypothetical protein